MIHLTRINRAPIVLNCELIEQIEATPDTVITVTSGRNYIVLETPDEVIRRTIDYRRQAARGPRILSTGADHGC